MSNPEAIAYEKAAEAAARGPVPETAELLDAIEGVTRRFVVISDEQRDVIALWVLHCYAIDAADTTPYLAITSPEKRSGKSRLLEVLAQLVPRAMEAANISDAALFRALGGDDLPMTLLFDEIDTVFGPRQAQSKEELRGLINAGYRRGAVAWRCVGEGSKQEVKPYPVFGPKALAGIGELPDTIADRSIPIRLRRKSTSESVERGRFRTIKAATAPLAGAAGRWADAHLETLRVAEPVLPDELSDRAQDGAEPLLAIADLAGEDWGERARAALVALHRRVGDDSASWGVQLLADTRAAFGEADRLSTADLLAVLKEDEEGPWASWGKGADGLTPRALAKLLKPFEIHSKNVHLDDGRKPKGFLREQFEDSWTRYLVPNSPRNGSVAATSATLALESHKQGDSIRYLDPPGSGFEGTANPHSRAEVAQVAAENGNGAENGAGDDVEADLQRIAEKFGEGL